MCNLNFNRNKTSGENTIRVILIPVAIWMGCYALVQIILFVISSEVAKNIGRNALIDQITRQSEIISYESSLLLERRLLNILEGVVSFMSVAVSDMTRYNYSLGFKPSYYDYDPLEPLTLDERHDTYPVSFGASTFYFPGSTPTQVFTTFELESVNQTVHMDDLFKTLYSNYEDLIQCYVGYESNGMFRRYPGNLTEDRSYDPRQRGWYTGAFGAIGDEEDFHLEKVYIDFNLKIWMKTISQYVKDYYTNEIVGVFGADITIDSLRDIVDSVSLLDSGKITIFETDGTVVADQEWDSNSQIGFTYQNLQNPSIPDTIWNDIMSTEVGETKTVEFTDPTSGDQYYAITAHLSSFEERFLLTAFTKVDEATSPIDPVLDEFTENRNNTIIISVIVPFVIIGIVILIVWSVSKCRTEKFNKLKNKTRDMFMRLGYRSDEALPVEGENGIEMVTFVEGEGHYQEEQEFNDAVVNLQNTLDQSRNVTTTMVNPFIDNKTFIPFAQPIEEEPQKV